MSLEIKPATMSHGHFTFYIDSIVLIEYKKQLTNRPRNFFIKFSIEPIHVKKSYIHHSTTLTEHVQYV